MSVWDAPDFVVVAKKICEVLCQRMVRDRLLTHVQSLGFLHMPAYDPIKSAMDAPEAKRVVELKRISKLWTYAAHSSSSKMGAMQWYKGRAEHVKQTAQRLIATKPVQHESNTKPERANARCKSGKQKGQDAGKHNTLSLRAVYVQYRPGYEIGFLRRSIVESGFTDRNVLSTKAVMYGVFEVLCTVETRAIDSKAWDAWLPMHAHI